MLYDSRNPAYKTPFGAVQAGTEVVFQLRLPRLWTCTAVRIHVIHEFGGEDFTVPFQWRGFEEDNDVYRGLLDTERLLGPVWYYFSFDISGRHGGYIGPAPGRTGGAGTRYDNPPPSFQLTVYECSDVPDWYGRGMTYQIFPDRFRRSRIPDPTGMVGRRIVHKSWSACPAYLPDINGEIRNNDFLGGDLQGIIEKLPYLQALGVKTLYLSPIFEAASNHRYDTADYLSVDPMLGDESDFSRLCSDAMALGIRVILDGVFNHTGYDSVYFNGRGSYPEPGAYQSRESRYYDWYDFTDWPDEYGSWWGIYTLPQVRESHPDYRDFIIRSDSSVIRKWLRLGASGWRLDVADELPDEFIRELREAVCQEKPDGIVIGEVWEDASNKIAYGVRRRYFMGRELDGVMNYPFRDAAIGFVLGMPSAEFAERMESLREHYPRRNYYSLMNALGTHDTPRILTVLGARDGDWSLTRTMKSEFTLPPEQYELAVRRLRVAAAILFAFPGSPTVYYGDEAGLQGFEDPFNRRGYPWGAENTELVDWVTLLAACRNDSEALQSGDIWYCPTVPGVLAFVRQAGEDQLICLVNRDGEPRSAALPFTAPYTDRLSGRRFAPAEGRLQVELEPFDVLYLTPVTHTV